MSLYQWGMLLSLIGFTMATLFAALLMEHRVVGSFADWLSEAFGDIHSRLNRKFPLPRRRLIALMYRYSLQTLALGSGVAFLVIPQHLFSSLNVWISISMILLAGVLPLVILYRNVWAEEGDDPNLYLGARLFAVCLVHEIIMLIISPIVILAIFLLEMMRAIFAFLSYNDEAKKMLVILGTLVAFIGLVLQFAASFA